MGIILFVIGVALLINLVNRKSAPIQEECKIHDWSYHAVPPHNMVCNNCGFKAGT